MKLIVLTLTQTCRHGKQAAIYTALSFTGLTVSNALTFQFNICRRLFNLLHIQYILYSLYTVAYRWFVYFPLCVSLFCLFFVASAVVLSSVGIYGITYFFNFPHVAAAVCIRGIRLYCYWIEHRCRMQSYSVSAFQNLSMLENVYEQICSMATEWNKSSIEFCFSFLADRMTADMKLFSIIWLL